ncbi:MAG: S26 family signal peptidase, partial [Chlamydiia bacterium]|nr:S26 family signal peptidase [Chlamydiia bacterium]
MLGFQKILKVMPLKITKVLPMKIPFFSKTYSIKKSKQILRHTFHAYTKKKSALNPSTQDTVEKTLSELQESILKHNKEQAHTHAVTAEQISNVYLKKTSLEKTKDLAITLVLALCAAVVIRQTWFELYEIPTGSMRPTLKEKDRV